jgi:hypothetical protein
MPSRNIAGFCGTGEGPGNAPKNHGIVGTGT